MQVIVNNTKQLDTVFADIMSRYDYKKPMAISYNVITKEKTKNQLGFFFGALAESVKEFYKESGVDYTTDEIKENFYNAVSTIDDSFLKSHRQFNGKEFYMPKRLSEMNVEDASLFIDRCIYLIDNAKCFKGLILHPSIRYTWVRKITNDDIMRIGEIKLPYSDSEYLINIRKQPCICCGKFSSSQPHHLKIAGESGTAFKSGDWATIPLCHDCHIGQLHQNGQDSFMKNLEYITKYIDIVDFCKMNYLRWKNKM